MASQSLSFHLNSKFIAAASKRPECFGFQGLGKFVYNRTYSRVVDAETGKTEEWYQTVERVVNGAFSLLKDHFTSNNRSFNETKYQKQAQTMYDLIFNMKFLPPGRGLWAMGTAIVHEKKLFAALNNCAFVTTEDIDEKKSKPFTFLMDMSMLGVGVGFDTKGAGKIVIKRPAANCAENPEAVERYIAFLNRVKADLTVKIEEALAEHGEGWHVNALRDDMASYDAEIQEIGEGTMRYREFIIPDTREGWVESLKQLLDSYFDGSSRIIFNYDEIRQQGLLLKTFGGVSSGPVPLLDMHIAIRKRINPLIRKEITETLIVDIMNLIGKAVVAGNVRRTAEIAIGTTNEEFLNLKDPSVNPDRLSFGWASNNSVFADENTNFDKIAKQIAINGEPGLVFLDNMRRMGRTVDKPDNKDKRAQGTNPCAEQTLESYEMCCLVELFISRCKDLKEFLQTVRYAYFYSKIVTLGTSHWQETNDVQHQNRRIGTSLSGIVDFLLACNWNYGIFREWINAGFSEILKYDKKFSKELAINPSIKTTSIKPSGCVALNTVLNTEEGPMSMGEILARCMPVDQLQLTTLNDGHWMDVVKPLNVYNSDGELTPVLQCRLNGVSEIYRIETDAGIIECTAEHQFMIDGEWVKACDLVPGMNL